MSKNVNTAIEWYTKYYSNERTLEEKGVYNTILKRWEKEVTSSYFPVNAKILDVGCGMGREAFNLYDMGFSITGIDISENAISSAKEFASETNRDIMFMTTNGKDLPFDNNSFDVIIIWNQTFGLFYGESNQVAFLKECKRVLKDNGIISFSGHDREYLELHYLHCLQDKKFYPFKDESIYWDIFTIGNMKELAQKSGFHILECQRGEIYREEDGTIIHCICRK